MKEYAGQRLWRPDKIASGASHNRDHAQAGSGIDNHQTLCVSEIQCLVQALMLISQPQQKLVDLRGDYGGKIRNTKLGISNAYHPLNSY